MGQNDNINGSLFATKTFNNNDIEWVDLDDKVVKVTKSYEEVRDLA